MSQMETTGRILETLSAELLALDAGDKDEIARLGAGMEALLGDHGLSDELKGLVSLSLRTMQGLYEQTVPAAAVEEVCLAIATVKDHLAGNPPPPTAATPAEASRRLEAALAGHAPQEAGPAPAPEEAVKTCVPAPQVPAAASWFAGPAILPADTDSDLLKEFIVECLDHVTAGEASLLNLEANPEDTEQINRLFRAFHTIKGTSGFLGLDRIQKLAHLAESLLNRAREGQIKIRGGYADLALKSCDMLKEMIEALRLAELGGELAIAPGLEEFLTFLADPEGHGVCEDADDRRLRLGDILVAQGGADRLDVERIAEDSTPDRKLGQALVESDVAKAGDVAKALRTQRKLDGGDPSDATIRVGTARLDSLINMVGELVIAQSMVAQDRTVAVAGELGRKVAHADKIVRALQDLTMSLRMVPLRATFQKMTRLVRDVARKSDKSVQLVTEGEGTEIDRTMVEALGDPLVHMIRNSVDHGIESPEQRRAAGKNPIGTVTLRAYHAAGKVVIELCDDGRGLNKDKILAKAVEKGLVPAGHEMPEGEVFALIFRPGFSTADTITDISGRGVGMDVVKRGVEALRGQVTVTSEPTVGTTFRLRLPLTMAISDAMLVRVGQERYLVPTISIEESFRPPAGSVMTVGGRGEMVQLRGRLLPLLRLHRLFGVSGAVTDPQQGLLIVLEGHSRRCALMVDELLGQQQVVIKTLGSTLANLAGVAGGAILGDGRVGLILDASGLVDLSDSDGGGRQAAA